MSIRPDVLYLQRVSPMHGAGSNFFVHDYEGCHSVYVKPIDTAVIENEFVRLAQEIILQAVYDYVLLRELGAVDGDKIVSKTWTKKFCPNGYNVKSAGDLLVFLTGQGLEDLGAACGIPVSSIRSRIGLIESSKPILVLKDLNWLSTPREKINKWHGDGIIPFFEKAA